MNFSVTGKELQEKSSIPRGDTVWNFKIFSVNERIQWQQYSEQGDPNQNLLIQMAITVKIFIFDHLLLKPKWVWEA